MKKVKFTIEYQLKFASINILWNSIANPLGLAEWFADGVTVRDDEYVFSWDKHEQAAYLLETKPNTSIRFQWEEDRDSDYYFQLNIRVMEVTSDLALIITDFAEPNEIADLKLLWDQQIDTLRRKIGA